MLNALRKGAGTWVAKILFGLLVLSFAAWGVGDWTGGFRRDKLAEVGGREISPEEFERAYQNQLAMLSAQLGRQVTSAEVRNYGLAQRVLQNLVGAAAVNIHASDLNLGISHDAIIQNIRNEDAFEGDDGKFSAERFNAVLRNNGLNEAGFIEMQRMENIRSQLVGTLTTAPYAPRTLVDALNHFRNDERTLKYFALPPESAGTVEAPTEEQLKKYYDDNKRSFMAPEFRRAGLLLLVPEKIKENITLSDADLKAAYEENKKTYSVPEKRTIQRLVFKDKAAADEASAKLAAGADFVQLGKELGLTDSDINVGTFTKDDFPDRQVADVAFSLEKDKPSQPIAGFVPSIVRVTEIAPGSQKSFEEAKAQVHEDLAKSRASDELAKVSDQIEDERAAGSTLAEIAKKVNLNYQEITVNKQGNDREGKRVTLPGNPQAVVKLIFESDVGVENNPVPLGEEAYAFVNVEEIIPERQRDFNDVREEAAKAWTDEEIRNRLTKKADDLVDAIGKGQTIEEAAKTVNAEVKTTPPLKRGGVEPGLPISAVGQAFTLPQNGAGSVLAADRKGRSVFQVASITPAPALDEKGAEQLREETSRGIGNDILAQYVNGLQTSYGVKVNPNAIATVTGQASGSQ